MASQLIELRRRVLAKLNDLTDEVIVDGQRYRKSIVNAEIDECAKHYAKYINQYYQGYLESKITINAVAGQRVYALGSAFRSPVYKVRRVINGFDYKLDPQPTYQFHLSTDSVPNSSWLPLWELEGNNIAFSCPPASNETGAVTVSHQLKLSTLTNDTDALEDQLYDAEDCIVIRAVKRLLQAKDVSGALKSIVGWNEELKDAEQVMNCQIMNRYVQPDEPLAVLGTAY